MNFLNELDKTEIDDAIALAQFGTPIFVHDDKHQE
jgi:hypothetical protein